MLEKVKNKIIVETTKALRSLDAFKFSGSVLYSMSKNLRQFSGVCEDIERSRQALVRKHDLTSNPEDPKALNDFQEEYIQLIELETEVTINKFKLKDFDLDENNIPVSVLASLGWLISDEEKVK